MVLGVDPGSVRTGVAATDVHQLLASPVGTFTKRDAVTGVVNLVAERSAAAVVVGYPINLSGRSGTAADAARSYAERLLTALAAEAGPDVPVFLVDERLTTVSASGALKAAGHSARSARRVVDQAAATALLQGVVDAADTRGVDCLAALRQGLGEQIKREAGDR